MENSNLPRFPRPAPMAFAWRMLVMASLVFATVSIAQVKPRELVLPNQGPSHGSNLQFSSDNSTLFYFDGKAVAMWDLVGEKVVGTIEPSTWQYVKTPDSTKIATVIDTKTIIIFDVASRQAVQQIKRVKPDQPGAKGGPQQQAFFQPCGFDEKNVKLFIRTETGLEVWDVKTGKFLRDLPTDKPPFNNLPAQSPDGRYISIQGTSTAAVELLDTRTEAFAAITDKDLGKVIGKPKGGYMSSLGSYTFPADGKTIYGVDQINNFLVGWSLDTGKMLDRGLLVTGIVQARISPDGTRLLYCRGNNKGPNNELFLRDTKKNTEIAKLGPMSKQISWFAISFDNRWVVCSTVGDTRMWDFGPQAPAKVKPATPAKPASQPAKSLRQP